MAEIASKPNYGETIIDTGAASPSFQVFLDEVEQGLNENLLGAAVRLPSYTVASVPAAASWAGSLIYVSDEAGGAVVAFSDGTNWRRVTDRAVVS